MNLIEQLGGLVYGVGVNDRSRPAYINNKATKEYDHWVGMLERCFGKNKHISLRETYLNCNCSDGFKSYSHFYDWCQTQIGFDQNGWQLDKDILFFGNKFYSEDNCVFVPSEVNNFIQMRNKLNTSGYYGTSYHKASKKYAAQISFNGKRKHLGLFENPKDAEKYYFLVKYKMAVELCNKYSGVLDDRVLKAIPEFIEIQAGRRL